MEISLHLRKSKLNDMESITLPNELRTNTIALNKSLRAHNEACKKITDIANEQLASIGNYEPHDLVTILRGHIARCIQAVTDNECYGPAERADRLRQWATVRQAVSRAAEAMEGFSREWPEAVLRYDEKSGEYVCVNADEVIRNSSTHAVPEDATLYIQLIAEVRAAIDHVRRFEQENGMKVMPLRTLLDMTQQDIIRVWLDNGFVLDLRYAPASKEWYYENTPKY